ncbi:MAG TPA: M1 family aminopeptidase, partial [Thermoanaerobaculia bacterium]
MKKHLMTCLAIVCLAISAFAADDPTYRAVRDAKPDGRSIALTNFTFERDVFRFTLNGALHLLAPVDGKTFGAVFIGQGSYELRPATAAEMRQVAIHANDEKLEILTDTFDSAVFFAPVLIEAAQKGSSIAGAAPAAANDRWQDYMNKQRKLMTTNVHVRIAQDLLNGDMLNGKSEPMFFVWLNGKKYPPAALVVDPRGAESLRLMGSGLGGEQSAMMVVDNSKGGIWYSSRLKSEVDAGAGVRLLPLADAEHYLIESNIEGAKLDGTTTFTFTPSSDVRLLPINIFGKMRISSASFAPAGDNATWTPVAWIQEKDDEDADAAVIFPEKLKAGTKYQLKVAYAGKEVLENAGDGNFYVGARQSWYANVGTFDDMATYETRFRVPQKMQIIGTGVETENKVEGGDRVQTWKSTNPIRVAGFNYGRFKKLSNDDKDSGMTVDVYTNPGTPDVVRQINDYLEATAAETGGPGFVRIDTTRLAQSAMADGINTARVGNMYFGPLAHKNVAITQQSQWNFGQSWPSLIYMPYIAFLNGTTRNTLGLNDAKDFIDSVGAHEFAHQWWGHQVGTYSYRDEWISEGFSEFTAGLMLQHTMGWKKYDDFWEQKRRHILDKGRGAHFASSEAGPISQGWRVSTWRTPGAYSAITYSKGAYVVH